MDSSNRRVLSSCQFILLEKWMNRNANWRNRTGGYIERLEASVSEIQERILIFKLAHLPRTLALAKEGKRMAHSPSFLSLPLPLCLFVFVCQCLSLSIRRDGQTDRHTLAFTNTHKHTRTETQRERESDSGIGHIITPLTAHLTCVLLVAYWQAISEEGKKGEGRFPLLLPAKRLWLLREFQLSYVQESKAIQKRSITMLKKFQLNQ